ncbi:hypothetical protein [Nocardia wallacei]|uniref:hypothetical protein n=1 Tax=Nocardia wallacei TaxID=480035 RepID=UPI002457C7DB|nr:hypothetical protein [Nocardia wallacei]
MDTITPAIERVTTDQLRPGDIVHHDSGMVLVIDQDIDSWPSQTTGRLVYGTSALIANWADLVATAKADAQLGVINSSAEFITHHHAGRPGEAARWVIQGNELALWYREIRSA